MAPIRASRRSRLSPTLSKRSAQCSNVVASCTSSPRPVLTSISEPARGADWRSRGKFGPHRTIWAGFHLVFTEWRSPVIRGPVKPAAGQQLHRAAVQLRIGYWRRRLTISSRRSGVSGRLTSATPSASATALAMHTGVLIEFPSATPLAPSGVTGDGVS